MTAPEFTPIVEREVKQFEREYYTVQHKLPGVVDWPQEIPPLSTADEALDAMGAHADWYHEGGIRAVRKVIRTTVEVLTIPLSN